MKEAPLSSPSHEKVTGGGIHLCSISFLGNGPYSLDVLPGECIGLTGHSGVGKTQLLRAVADVIAHGGECLLSGKTCSSYDPPAWRKRVAMVPAESYWWYDTVAPHFQGGTGQGSGCDLLQQLGFPADVGSWRISRLSTGERQRLALVRSLSRSPRVLLLDEPTSSLDKEMALVVEKIVKDFCRTMQVSCLWVSHDREQLARVADRIYRVEKQALVEEEMECL